MEYSSVNWAELPLEVFAHILEGSSVTNAIRLTSVCKTWRENLLNDSIWKAIYQRNFMVIKDEPTAPKTFRERAIKCEIITTNMIKKQYITRWKKMFDEDVTQTVSVAKDKLLISTANSSFRSTSSSALWSLNSLTASKVETKCKNMVTTKDYYVYFVSTHPGVSNLCTGQKLDFLLRSLPMQLTRSLLLPIDNRQLLTVTLNANLEENSFIAWSKTLQKLFWIDPASNKYKVIPLSDKLNEARIDGRLISYSVQDKSVTHVYDWEDEKYVSSIEHERNIYSWMIYRDHVFTSDSDGWYIIRLNGEIIKRCQYSLEDNSPSTIGYHNGIVVLQTERVHLFFNGCTTELLCELKFDKPFVNPKLIGRNDGEFLLWSKQALFLINFENNIKNAI